MAAGTHEWTALENARVAPQLEGSRPRLAVYRFSGPRLVVVAAVFAVLCAVFWKAIGWLWNTWTDLPEYSHGPILPLIAAFLVWQQKDRLERLEFDGTWWGCAAVAMAGLLFILGVLGSTYTVQQYALVLAACGLALSLTGRRAVPMLAMPALVVILMVPQPQFILANLSSELQLISSAVGVAAIRALGISVYLEGNVIDLGPYKLQVVDACAGLRYLFPLMAIGLLVAYFYKGAFWKRVLVFIASVPLTILMNSLRVAMIGVLVEHWGIGMAEGFVHDFQGWAVFMLSATLLVALTAALSRVGAEQGSWRELFGLTFPAPTPADATVRSRVLPTPFIASAVLVGVIGAGSVALSTHPEHAPDRQPFATFPVRFGDWKGTRTTLEPEILDTLQLDDYFLADYRRPNGEAVSLYMAYYATQRDRRTAHSPRSCIPGGGWRIVESSLAKVADGITANRMVISQGDQRALVYYWFDQRGRRITNEYAVKWWLFWDAVRRQRSDGALVRLVTPLSAAEDPAAADRRVAELAAAMLPLLPRYVPN